MALPYKIDFKRLFKQSILCVLSLAIIRTKANIKNNINPNESKENKTIKDQY